MTALALISDLHANLVALDAVLEDIRSLDVDQIVCLGDIVDLGPEPQATVDRLRERGIPCVRGNHDTLDEHPKVPMLAHIEDWTRKQLDGPTQSYLASLPLELEIDLDGARVWCVHGSPRDVREPLVVNTPESDVEAWIAGRSFDVLACGHTHVPLTRHHRGRWLVNVGSVGMPLAEPFDGRPPRVLTCSDYAIVRCRRGVMGAALSIEHRRIPLDLEAVARSAKDASLPDRQEWLRHWQ